MASTGEPPSGGFVCSVAVGGIVGEGQEMFSDLHEMGLIVVSDCSETGLSGLWRDWHFQTSLMVRKEVKRFSWQDVFPSNMLISGTAQPDVTRHLNFIVVLFPHLDEVLPT